MHVWSTILGRWGFGTVFNWKKKVIKSCPDKQSRVLSFCFFVPLLSFHCFTFFFPFHPFSLTCFFPSLFIKHQVSIKAAAYCLLRSGGFCKEMETCNHQNLWLGFVVPNSLLWAQIDRYGFENPCLQKAFVEKVNKSWGTFSMVVQSECVYMHIWHAS